MIFAAALLLQAAAPLPPPPSAHAVPMKPAREYVGLWFDQFEGERFFPAAADPRRVDWTAPAIWFGVDRLAVLRAYADARAPGAILPDPMQATVYRVRFIGREAQDMACRSKLPKLGGCYGHMGMEPGLIVPDRILSIEDLGPVPRVSSGNRR